MLPAKIVPMEPVSVKAPQGGEEYIHEIKWDGVMLLAFVEGSGLRLQNRRLHDRSGVYPELDPLPGLIDGRDAVLDGEVVVIENGLPSFPLTLRREQACGSAGINRAAARYPVVYMVFDLLYWDGRDLRALPLQERRSLLEKNLRPSEAVRLVKQYKEGDLLLTATGEKGLEGVVSKELLSPYLPGKSRRWLKIKHRRRLKAVVGGYLERSGRPASLLLGLYRAGDFIYIGRVGSGLSKEHWRKLKEFLFEITSQAPPFVNPPRMIKGMSWVDPCLPVEIEFQQWTPSLLLRSPVVVGFPKVDPGECTLPD